MLPLARGEVNIASEISSASSKKRCILVSILSLHHKNWWTPPQRHEVPTRKLTPTATEFAGSLNKACC
jgi:hypothetical protein